MDLQQAQSKRQLGLSGLTGSSSVSSLSYTDQYIGYQSPCGPSLPAEQVPVTCSRCSGALVFPQSEASHFIKRRRISNRLGSYPTYEPLYMGTCWENEPTYHGNGLESEIANPDSSLVSAAMPNMGHGPGVSSSLTGRLANLGLFLCSCPQYESLDGYEPLANSAESRIHGYSPDEPYMREKSPSAPRMEQSMVDVGSFSLRGSSQDSSQPNHNKIPVNQMSPVSRHSSLSESNVQRSGSLSETGFYTDNLQFEHASANEPFPNIARSIPRSFDENGQPVPQLAAETYASTSVDGQQDEDYRTTRRISSNDVSSLNGWNLNPSQDQPSQLDILLSSQRGGKRGPFRDPALREQTAQTRKIGSCIRCRMQRIRCEHNPSDPGGPCMTCKRVTSSKAGRFPCLRYKITDIRLYKPGQVPGYEWTRRWDDSISDPIQKWASEDIKIIRISEGYSTKGIELRVRRFVPSEGDKLERSWSHCGQKVSAMVPPFALTDLDHGKAAYSQYIKDAMGDTFRKTLGSHNGLLYQTYLQAWQVCRDSNTPMESLELLNRTLRLWMSVRLTTKSVFIVGDEKLGMPDDILDDTSPTPGRIPVPPVLGAQLDVILIHHIQTKLRRELLEKLQRVILKNKQSNWLLIYLVTFILLHNSALIIAHDESYARKHGIQVRLYETDLKILLLMLTETGDQRRFAREDKVKEYHLGANILLAHFHYCNKGTYPFSADCKDQELRNLGELSDDKVQFVRATRSCVRRNELQWESIRRTNAYADPYFYVSQMFEEDWQPSVLKV